KPLRKPESGGEDDPSSSRFLFDSSDRRARRLLEGESVVYLSSTGAGTGFGNARAGASCSASTLRGPEDGGHQYRRCYGGRDGMPAQGWRAECEGSLPEYLG